MDVNEAIEIIRRHRQAFAFGVEGVHSLFNTGIDGGDPMKPLNTSIVRELVHTSFFLPRAKMNTQLEQATTNRLGMQLVVGTGDAVKRYVDNWQEHPVPDLQFLRQIRNGAAHNNRLEFRSQRDPRDHTQWRGLGITPDMEGDLIFTDTKDRIWGSETVEMEPGFMEAGDALGLTTDVLQHLLLQSEKYGPENIIGISDGNFSEDNQDF